MVSAVAGLEEGVITPYETILDRYEFTAITPSPKDHTRNSHGKVDVANALEVSCNYYFYELGYRLSLDSAKNYRSQLGLDKIKKYAEMLALVQQVVLNYLNIVRRFQILMQFVLLLDRVKTTILQHKLPVM